MPGACDAYSATPVTVITGVWGVEPRGPEDRVHPSPSREMAAFMACAYAKFTGELGVCIRDIGTWSVHT